MWLMYLMLESFFLIDRYVQPRVVVVALKFSNDASFSPLCMFGTFIV